MNQIRAAICRAALGPARTIEPGTVERSFRFAADFPGYAGHFPGYAVLPAVVQVLTAAIVAEELAGTPLRLLGVDGAKFLRQLRPDDEITVRCRTKRDTGELLCEAQLAVAAAPAATFQLLLTRTAAPC